MINIRPYDDSDSEDVGRLIAHTYSIYNLDFVPPTERGPFLGPFQYANSLEKEHQEAIARVICAEIVLLAIDESGEIAGVLRGRRDRLHSLFVRSDRHKMVVGDHGETLQLFDMREDPRELVNLAGRDDMAEVERTLKDRILEWKLTTDTEQAWK